MSFWSGLLAPAGTPVPVLKRLQEEVARVLSLPDIRQRISALSVTPTASTSEDFARLIASEIPLWKRVALDKHIQPN